MGTPKLFRSEALSAVFWLRPCIRLRLVQASDQDTNLVILDLHNAPAPSLDPLISRFPLSADEQLWNVPWPWIH